MTRTEKGFTLVELLVSMGLLAILLAVAFPLLGSSIRSSGEVEERSTLQAELRWAVEQLTRDLRQAYTGDRTAAIESLGASQITFLSPDRAQPFHIRRIAYRVNSGRLERAMAVSTDTDGPPWVIPPLGAWVPVVGSLTNPSIFTFEDANGAPTANPALVRRVVVQLVVATKTASARPLTYRTSVNLRVVA